MNLKMLSKFLDPKNDICFKKIFGTEKNKDILIHFLNDMLIFRGKNPIKDVTFLKTVQDPDIAVRKTSIVDVLCKDEKGNRYIVELQVAKEKGFEKRAQYYASKAYLSQTHVGGIYENLKEVIFLAISNFEMFPNKNAYKSDHLILDRETGDHDLKDFSFTFLELPKFKKESHELSNITEKWMYFFKHAEETSEDDIEKIIGGDDILERAYDELNRFSWNEEELLIYEQSEKYEHTYRASMDQKFDEGIEIGIEKGEFKAKKEMANRLLQKGLSKEDIAEITGLKEGEF